MHFTHFVLTNEHFLHFKSAIKGSRLNAGDLIAPQIQFDEIWQTTKETIGFDAAELVVIQQAGN